MTQPDTLIHALDSLSRAPRCHRHGAQAFARLLDWPSSATRARSSRGAVHRRHLQRAAFAFDLFDLRALDIEISDDMLRCLDALRWARADLYTLVPDGDARVRSVIDRWGLQWPDDG